MDFDDSVTSGAEYRRTTAFSFEVLEPLSAVTKPDLTRYFKFKDCTCPETLRPLYPGLLLHGRREMSFAEAVGQIRAARDRGWDAKQTDLEESGRPAPPPLPGRDAPAP